MSSLNNSVKEAFRQLDTASKQRAGLIENLVSAVRPLTDINPDTLQALEKLRETPEDWQARITREDQITRKFKDVFIGLQDHPEMQLDAAFEKLQDSIIQAERTYRRNKNDYNGAVHRFNAFAQLIPFNIVCRVSEMQTPQFFTAKDGLSSAE